MLNCMTLENKQPLHFTNICTASYVAKREKKQRNKTYIHPKCVHTLAASLQRIALSKKAFGTSKECICVSQMIAVCYYGNISGLSRVYLCVFTYEICWDIMRCFFSFCVGKRVKKAKWSTSNATERLPNDPGSQIQLSIPLSLSAPPPSSLQAK